MSERKKDAKDDAAAPAMPFDDVLKRMLSTPPKHHKDERVNPKPAQPTKKPAK